MIQLSKTRLELWEKNISKTSWRHCRKHWDVWRNPYLGRHLVSQFVIANRCRRNGLQHRWCEDFAKDVGRATWGRRLALPGPMGCCAHAHIIQRLKCPAEVRAARSEGCMLGLLRVAGFSLFTVFGVLGRFSHRRPGCIAIEGRIFSCWGGTSCFAT